MKLMIPNNRWVDVDLVADETFHLWPTTRKWRNRRLVVTGASSVFFDASRCDPSSDRQQTRLFWPIDLRVIISSPITCANNSAACSSCNSALALPSVTTTSAFSATPSKEKPRLHYTSPSRSWRFLIALHCAVGRRWAHASVFSCL